MPEPCDGPTRKFPPTPGLLRPYIDRSVDPHERLPRPQRE